MPKGNRKGSAFERQVACTLSRWWSGGERDDIFWRTPASGAMATQRQKGGKDVRHAYGDIQAHDPVGQPLLDLFMIEIKRGYSGSPASDLIEKEVSIKPSIWESWIIKTTVQCRRCPAPFWMIISKRDLRLPIVCVPDMLESTKISSLRLQDDLQTLLEMPMMLIRGPRRNFDSSECLYFFYTLDRFLQLISPAGIISEQGCKRRLVEEAIDGKSRVPSN